MSNSSLVVLPLSSSIDYSDWFSISLSLLLPEYSSSFLFYVSVKDPTSSSTEMWFEFSFESSSLESSSVLPYSSIYAEYRKCKIDKFNE